MRTLFSDARHTDWIGALRCRRSRRAWRAFLVLAAPFAAAFSPPSSGLEGLPTVPDRELGTMRGKFITPEAISYFGIALQSSWQGADGITTSANILFSVGFLNGVNGGASTPQLLISWSREGDPSMDLSNFGSAAQQGYVAVVGSELVPLNGLGSVQGAVQSNSIAGTDNLVHNGMTIAVVPASAVQQMSGNGMTAVDGSQQQTFADGDTLHFVLTGDQIGLMMQSGDGKDVIRQSFDGNIGQAAQNVILNDSFNSVHNMMGITIGVDQLRQIDRVRADGALSAMKGNGF